MLRFLTGMASVLGTQSNNPPGLKRHNFSGIAQKMFLKIPRDASFDFASITPKKHQIPPFPRLPKNIQRNSSILALPASCAHRCLARGFSPTACLSPTLGSARALCVCMTTDHQRLACAAPLRYTQLPAKMPFSTVFSRNFHANLIPHP